VTALAIALAAAAVATPPPEHGWALHAAGGLALAGPAFTGTSRFTLFAEEATLSTRRQAEAGPVFEAGLWRAVSRRLGIALTATRDRRDDGGVFSAALPHPLYLGRPRTAEGVLPGGVRRETAVHLGLAWSPARGEWTARVSAGPSWLRAEADLAEDAATTESYPYDAVDVTTVRSSAVRGDALGGHAAVSLERRLGTRFAAGAGARWSRASVDLGAGARSARVTAGGLSASFGVRVYF
jgi:hypothetical protein